MPQTARQSTARHNPSTDHTYSGVGRAVPRPKDAYRSTAYQSQPLVRGCKDEVLSTKDKEGPCDPSGRLGVGLQFAVADHDLTNKLTNTRLVGAAELVAFCDQFGQVFAVRTQARPRGEKGRNWPSPW